MLLLMLLKITRTLKKQRIFQIVSDLIVSLKLWLLLMNQWWWWWWFWMVHLRRRVAEMCGGGGCGGGGRERWLNWAWHCSYILWKIEFCSVSSESQCGFVVGSCGGFRRVECSEPHSCRLVWISNLRCPFSPWPLPNSSVPSPSLPCFFI